MRTRPIYYPPIKAERYGLAWRGYNGFKNHAGRCLRDRIGALLMLVIYCELAYCAAAFVLIHRGFW